MNNEQPNNTERFYLEELKFGGFAICDHEISEAWDEVCFYRPCHPYAKKAAEDERDRLNAWNKECGTLRLVEYLPPPKRFQLVGGTFSEAASTLTVEEKRRYLANVFRSPEFTDSDKFKALQEDNRMLALCRCEHGKEQE